jgi:phage terminase small subunit
MALTNKQKMFVKEYQIDRNATQAAIRAGYSKKSAMEQGYQLLQKTPVKAALDKQTEKIAAKVDITAEDVLQSIKDIRDECKGDKKYNEALKANELLGKHLKLFTDKHEHTGPEGGPMVIERLIVDKTTDTNI